MKKSNKELTVREKILACYPHLYSKSIHKILGISYASVFQCLQKEGLRNVTPIRYCSWRDEKIRRRNKKRTIL